MTAKVRTGLLISLALGLFLARDVMLLSAWADFPEGDVLRETNIRATEAHVTLLGDGGCEFVGIGVGAWDGGTTFATQSDPFPFNGARCTTVRDAAKRAVNYAFRRGDGGIP